jgi:hypothetical protein
MVAVVIRIGCSFVVLVVLVSVVSCAFLARLGVPAGVPVTGGIAPDARLVVTADVAPMYVEPDATARIVGSFSNGVQVRAMGLDTSEWVRVRSIDPIVAGWVRRASQHPANQLPRTTSARRMNDDADNGVEIVLALNDGRTCSYLLKSAGYDLLKLAG